MSISVLFATDPALTLGLIIVGMFIGLFLRGRPIIMLLFLAVFGYYGFMGYLFVNKTDMKEEIKQHGSFERALQKRTKSYTDKTIRELEKHDH